MQKILCLVFLTISANSYSYTVDNMSLQYGDHGPKSAVGAAFSSSKIKYKLKDAKDDAEIERRIMGAYAQHQFAGAIVNAEFARNMTSRIDIGGNNAVEPSGSGYSYGAGVKRNIQAARFVSLTPALRYNHIAEDYQFDKEFNNGLAITDSNLRLEYDEVTVAASIQYTEVAMLQPFAGLEAQPYQEGFVKGKSTTVRKNQFGVVVASGDSSTNRSRFERKDVFGMNLGVNSVLDKGMIAHVQAELISEVSLSGGFGYRF